MSANRRKSERHPVGFYVEQFVADEPYRCFTTDLSALGLYMERLVEPIDRPSRLVQLEITLPSTSDSLWAAGEVVYDRIGSLFHGTAVRFTGMARTHQRWLRDWLRDARRGERFTAFHPGRRPAPVRVKRPLSGTLGRSSYPMPPRLQPSVFVESSSGTLGRLSYAV